MEPSELCQALLDHLADQLPPDDDSLLSLRGVALFQPSEASFVIIEAIAVLMRTGCRLSDDLVAEVNDYLCGPRRSAPTDGDGPLALSG